MSPELKQDTLPEDPTAVGSAKDVEDLMRKYDKESNTRTVSYTHLTLPTILRV